MRKTLGSCLLVLLLTCSAGAGEMPNFSNAAPPPQSSTATQEPAEAGAQGDEPTAAGEMPNDASYGLADAALGLLALLQSLV